ncbi:MAG: hypothetical protein IJW64_01875 [Clostridia bacterium]|nr:hypothetical protein [Clostridia bacterium]
MITARESVEKFDEKSSELINSKFLLAEKKIEELLVTIADSVLLYEIFEHVSEGFDYATFKSVCFSHLADGKGYFRLPKNDADVIAFCFSLLLEIDGGKVDLLELCDEFFPTEEGKQKGYNLFASQLLIPFKQATLNVAYAVLDEREGERTREEKPSKTYQNSQENKSLPVKENSALNYVCDLKNKAVETASENQGLGIDYDELIFVLEELEYYLKNGNLRGVTLAFTALKYLSENFVGFAIDLKKLAELISEVV